MQHQMRQFHEMLQTGKDTGEAHRLRHWLVDHPQEELRIRMRRSGLQNYELITLDLIDHTEALLEIHLKYGPGKAQADAKLWSTEALLESYAARIIPLPCDFIPPEDARGSSLTGLGKLKQLPQETVIAGSLLSLVLGAAGMILLERLARRRLRRAKRHPCLLPCILVSDGHRFDARIEDVSQLGAKIRVWLDDGKATPLITGKIAAEVCGRMVIEAQTNWQNNNYVGVKFRRRLTRDELKVLLVSKPVRSTGPAVAPRHA
ncbi:PilZ domain-containing protein [Leisingera sp. D0M16]|uniref:PilZ domain-containing protein n=1 Tax=Leisingera coralii TaxID=3351347 RepID=UPI003B7B568E